MIQSPLVRSKPMNFRMGRASQTRCLLAVTAILLTLILLLAALSNNAEYNHSCDSTASTVFDVVIDAGSTGSRVHIFEFERKDGELIIETEYVHRVQPGLSSFADHPDEAVSSVKQLLDVAVSRVPRRYHSCTSVTLKATAGLRLLPEAKSQSILDKVRRFIETKTPFTNRGVSIISGNEEGVYGWMTVNYLLGRVFSTTKPSVAIMEMGGASAQLVFEAGREDGEWVPYNYVSHLRINGRSIVLYHHSYLGLGLNEARRRVYKAASTNELQKQQNSRTTFPCFPPQFAVGTEDRITLEGGSEAGMQSYDECRRAVVGALLPSTAPSRVCQHRQCGIDGVPQPELLPETHSILAFSYFFDRLKPFLRSNDHSGDLRVAGVRQAGVEVCNTANHSQNKETTCLDLVYMYAYLHDGLGLPDDAVLSVRESINGKHITWSLGASLLYLLRADL